MKWQWHERKQVLKKVALAVVGGLALTGALAVAWPFIGLFLHAVMDSLAPSAVGWNAKNAWVKCDGAIAGTVAWPATPAAACAAMHLCANEATLKPDQLASLKSAARRLPGCSEP